MNEDSLSRDLISFLTLRGFLARKMHGSLMQSGVPDWLIFNPTRVPFMLEMKVLSQAKPTLQQVVNCLRPSQRKFLCEIRGSHCGVIVFCIHGLAFVPAHRLPKLLQPADPLPLSQFVLSPDKLLEILS